MRLANQSQTPGGNGSPAIATVPWRESMFAFTRPTLSWLALLCGGIGLVAGADCAARGAEPEQIVVRLTSGRTFTAAVDDRSDGDRLWLRFDRGGISVLRGVAWQNVERAWRGERALSASELQQAIDELRSARWKSEGAGDDSGRAAEPEANPLPERLAPERIAPERIAAERIAAERIAARPVAADLVRSIGIDAAIARWTGGAESDGVVLRVLPLGAEGQVIAASGTLEVDLFGDQYGSPTRGQDYRLLGHWTARLDAEQVTPEGAAIRLPFQAVSADLANDLGPFAVVHVRFTAPGHGTFDASTNPIRLRPYNGVRDRLQQAQGTRFFPNERTNRGPSVQRDPR